MFKQSRRKILISIMATLICLFLGILVIIYSSSFRDVSDENYKMLERYAQLYTTEEEAAADNITESDTNDETSDINKADNSLPDDESEQPAGLSKPASGNPDSSDIPDGSDIPDNSDIPESSDIPDSPDDPEVPDSPPAENDPPPESTPAFRLSTFYSVAISDDGDILETENTNISYDDDALEDIATEIINSNKSKGIRGNLIYYTMKKDGYTLVAFVDNTIMQESMSTLFRYTLIYGSIAIILIFFLAIFLARRIVNPLEKSYQMQKQFISDAGHELKTPIAVIDANAELLSHETGENTWLSNIQYENDRMGALVTQMLELARTENTVLPMERLDFSRVAEGEALPFESIAFEKELHFICRITEGIYVQGNTVQLKQLLSILLDNALHHCTQNGEIEISLHAERNTALLSVINDGEAIPPESRDRIFERFYRADSARSSDDNRYGLGLAIARAIVTAHHGNIHVLCHDEKVEFTVTLPSLK